MNISLPTTENHIWVQLRFKIAPADRNLPRREARKRAIAYRRMGRLARVRWSPVIGWFVATYRPRRNAPRPVDLRL